jgi:hypothetical protein
MQSFSTVLIEWFTESVKEKTPIVNLRSRSCPAKHHLGAYWQVGTSLEKLSAKDPVAESRRELIESRVRSLAGRAVRFFRDPLTLG